MITAPVNILRRGTDYAAGWEVGRNQGRERIGRKLFNRLPPEHLRSRENTCRARNWESGYLAGLAARKSAAKSHILYKTVDGRDVSKRGVGSVGKLVTAAEKDGAYGDVWVWTPAGILHKCGI